MKSPLLLLPALAFVSAPLWAQVIVQPGIPPAPVVQPGLPQPPPVVVPGARVLPGAPPPPGTTVQVVTPGVRVFDPLEARRRLSTPPQVIAAPSLPAGVTTIPPGATAVETTRTTTTVETPGLPTRVYNSERSTVIVQDQGQNREMQYVTLPVLFVKETAELLDAESRAALDQIAEVILGVLQTEPGAVFDIEGHTSTDGTDEFNMSLSAARAQRIYDELTQRYRVPASALSAHGYGENHPTYPSATEDLMQLDRRVLVVRTK